MSAFNAPGSMFTCMQQFGNCVVGNGCQNGYLLLLLLYLLISVPNSNTFDRFSNGPVNKTIFTSIFLHFFIFFFLLQSTLNIENESIISTLLA